MRYFITLIILVISIISCDYITKIDTTDYSDVIITNYHFTDTLWNWKIDSNSIIFEPAVEAEFDKWWMSIQLYNEDHSKMIDLGSHEYILMNNQIIIDSIDFKGDDFELFRPFTFISPRGLNNVYHPGVHEPFKIILIAFNMDSSLNIIRPYPKSTYHLQDVLLIRNSLMQDKDQYFKVKYEKEILKAVINVLDPK